MLTTVRGIVPHSTHPMMAWTETDGGGAFSGGGQHWHARCVCGHQVVHSHQEVYRQRIAEHQGIDSVYRMWSDLVASPPAVPQSAPRDAQGWGASPHRPVMAEGIDHSA